MASCHPFWLELPYDLPVVLHCLHEHPSSTSWLWHGQLLKNGPKKESAESTYWVDWPYLPELYGCAASVRCGQKVSQESFQPILLSTLGFTNGIYWRRAASYRFLLISYGIEVLVFGSTHRAVGTPRSHLTSAGHRTGQLPLLYSLT